MEKAITAVALIILGVVIVGYWKELIVNGKHMLGHNSTLLGIADWLTEAC